MTMTQRIEDVRQHVERETRLDLVAKPLRGAAQRALSPAPAREVLSGRPIGHPLHPALVLVSGGALLSATVLDLVGGKGARKASQRLIAVGLIAALPTAASGLSDWMDTEDAESRIGVVHAASNSIALAAFTRSWRRHAAGKRGVLSSLTGAAALGAGGWLGGHLAYALGVGVDTTAFQSAAQDWTDVAAATDIDDNLHQAHVDGVAILLTRVDGKVTALADRCTHRGGPLSEGKRYDDCVVCPWHGSKFALRDGAVLNGPASRPQPAFEVREQNGRIEVRRTEPRALRRNPA
jgi:nitrite reductase/ring-hydroxylating ferredoxin subunit/uncharacterized membrane protein